MGCPQISAPLFGTRSSIFPSSRLGGTCCQWDQSGVFAGLYLVWTFLTSPSPPPLPSSVDAGEPPPPCSSTPGPIHARGDCDIGVHERGFVFGEQSPQGGCRAAQRGWAFCLLGSCSVFEVQPTLPAAPLLQKVMQGVEMVGMVPSLPSCWCQASSEWKEDVFLKPHVTFAVIQRASPILASSFG